MSQQSHLYPSSAYGYEDSELGFPPSTETSFSQLNPIFFPEPFLLTSKAPLSLKRAGFGGSSPFVLYPEMDNTQFIEWWLTTQYGDPKRMEPKKPLDWARKRTSKHWKDFVQVAHEDTGRPKILCQRCGTILDHPNWNPSGPPSGTSCLQRHLNSHTCQLRSGQSRSQPGIPETFTHMVIIGPY